MPALPSGTVTFLFTDIECSTRHWETNREAMSGALARHDALVRASMKARGSAALKTVGDAFCAAFHRAPDALAAALEAQHELVAEPWARVKPIRTRVALHTGTVNRRSGDYFGPVVNRAARLLASGWGGQFVVSHATAELQYDALPSGVRRQDLGEHRLRDLGRPERIYQAVAGDLPADFPALRTIDARPSNLTVQPTPFIGGDREIEEVRTFLARPVKTATCSSSSVAPKFRETRLLRAMFTSLAWFGRLKTTQEPLSQRNQTGLGCGAPCRRRW